MDRWTQLASEETVQKTIVSLKANNIDVFSVDTKEEAKTNLLGLLPAGAQVFTVTSMTLEALGVLPDINESGVYDSVRKKLLSMNRETQRDEMRRLGASPDWVVGSVHAVTEGGEVMIASQTGSQLSSYVSGAGHVVWVVGTHKIVKNADEGFRRMYEHALPLEAKRAEKAYGRTGSSVNKVLIINKEFRPGRISLIFVKQVLGF